MLPMKKMLSAFSVLFFTVSVGALDQTTPYILTDFPISLIRQDTAIWIKWAGATRFPTNPLLIPDSGRIYYSKLPGGSIVSNYKDSVTKRKIDTLISGKDTSKIAQDNILFPGAPPQRGIKFRPVDNSMEPGRYYIIVAWKTKIGPKDTTFFSNEIQLIIEANTAAKLLSPANNDTITNLSPTFQWSKVAGVPYYHIIVSDEEIKPDLDNKTVQGLSIVWEAITVNGSMQYGAPDPSGTITTNPPPLSPGKIYSWIVLNNYGNHPAYSSCRVFSLPCKFSVKGEPLKKPKNLWSYKDTITSSVDSTLRFKWTNLDKKANTYMVYTYIASNLDKIGAQMVVWSTEVTAGQFTNDTGYVALNAKAVLTDNRYTWKVIAIDATGAGTAGDTTGFYYRTPSGTLRAETYEQIVSGTSTITKAVGLVKVEVEVLDGSLEAPLLFYTDDKGTLSRKRPVGTYRLTATKDGFEAQTKTVSIKDGETNTSIFIMKRPDATIYGKVMDEAKQPLNLAEVVGVSERNDTILAQTDPLGSFILSCYQADWVIFARKTGYITSFSVDTSVTFGQNVSLSTSFILKKNPYILSGIVKNDQGNPLMGVNVQVLRNSVLIGEIPSTGQDGTFSFEVESGTYTVVASKVGFVTYRSSMDMLSSKQIAITMPAGAALVTGTIIGKSWNSSNVAVFASITNASIRLINSVTPFDTVTAVADAVYGNFGVSVGGGKTYRLYASANGYKTDTTPVTIVTLGGKTYTVTDTLVSLATLKGNVRVSDTVSSAIGNVAVSIIDSVTNQIVVTSKSDALGSFEIRNIPDGFRYKLQAGLSGFVQDSTVITDIKGGILSSDRLWVADGRPIRPDNNEVIATATVTMERGNRAIQWLVKNGKQSSTFLTNATVKIKSPLVKTVQQAEIVGGVGIGSYIVQVDAGVDTIVGCSYHKYDITDASDSLSIDTVFLPVTYHPDSVRVLVNGVAKCTLSVADTLLKSGYLYFRDVNEQTYDSVSYTEPPLASGSLYNYVFPVTPHKDGSYMIYYFKLSWKSNIYGSAQKTYRSYIKPDTALLKRLEISPYKGDTLLLPADGDMTFTFNGYYGSNFQPATQLSAANVSWTFVSDIGCTFSKKEKDVTIHTASGGSGNSIGILQASFVQNDQYKLATGVSGTLLVYFKVSAYKLDSVWILRVDPDPKGYITTSPLEKAEFAAEGVDEKGNRVTVAPQWKMIPATAGILTNGIFKPVDNYIGRVQFTITAGNIIGEYFDQGAKKSGLSVHYLMTSLADTVSNGIGCQVLLPANIISANRTAELSLEIPVLKNQIYKTSTLDSTMGDSMTGTFNVMGDVYDITDVDSAIAFQSGVTDSITIALSIPNEYQKDAAGSVQRYYIAQWRPAKEDWLPLKKSIIASDGSTLYVKTTHFSRYAIVRRSGGLGAGVEIKPNPFSPYVRPVAELVGLGIQAQQGTLIKVSSNAPGYSINLDIYNIVGDKVWSVVLQKAGMETKVWWDGKTMTRTVALDEKKHKLPDGSYKITGDSMCRNGRYFLVVSVSDNQKIKRYMKNLVLFK